MTIHKLWNSITFLIFKTSLAINFPPASVIMMHCVRKSICNSLLKASERTMPMVAESWHMIFLISFFRLFYSNFILFFYFLVFTFFILVFFSYFLYFCYFYFLIFLKTFLFLHFFKFHFVFWNEEPRFPGPFRFTFLRLGFTFELF